MTTATEVKFVRYNAGMGSGPFGFGSVKLIGQGVIIEVTDDNAPSVLRRIHGDEADKRMFTPVDSQYVDGLPRCTACRVYFESDTLKERHIKFHAERAQSSPELAKLAAIDRADGFDDLEIERLLGQKHARAKEREKLKAELETAGLFADIQDGKPIRIEGDDK